MKIHPIILLLGIGICTSAFAQKTGKTYKVDRYKSIYLPLGKISFADSIHSFTMGDPMPLEKFRDPQQSLHEPNYENYHTPNFLSIGCKGVLELAFTDNGFMNLPGNDLYIFEVGPSKESAKIEISTDGTEWSYAGTISGGKSMLDLEDEGIPADVIYSFLRITDMEDLCRSKTAGADIDAVAAINSVIKLTINADVIFDVAEYTLKSSANKTLDSLANLIKKVDKATIVAEGHTDSDGSDITNMKLSENRCLSVIDRMRALLGYEAAYDYEVKAFGETNPKVANDSKENKQINRRVELLVLPPKDYYKYIPKKKD